MDTYRVMLALPLLALLFWAAVVDARTRRIPNWLTLGLILSGLIQSWAGGQAKGSPAADVLAAGSLTPAQSLLGFLAGFALPALLFFLGALGGGDVKLLAGIGAWVGPGPVFRIFLLAAIIGAVIVLAQAAIQKRTRPLLRNTAVLAINLAHVGDVGVEHVSQTGRSCRSIDRPLPYAVPIFLASLLVLALQWRWP